MPTSAPPLSHCIPPPVVRFLAPAPTPAPDAQDLRHRVAARDPQAFEQLYERYGRRLRGYLRRRLPPQVLAEDVFHEVLLLLWRQGVRCAPGTSLEAWLFGVARRKASEARRAHRPRQTPSLVAGAQTAEALEDAVMQHDRVRMVRQAVAALPPAERQVVALTYAHDCSYPEIAALLACPVNTVKTRMARARRHLRLQLRA